MRRMKIEQPQGVSSSLALLREIKAQKAIVERNIEAAKQDLARLDGQLMVLHLIQARLRGGMIPGFDKIDTTEEVR